MIGSTGTSGRKAGAWAAIAGLLALAGGTLLAAGRSDREQPPARRTVVVVPGITGVELADSETGDVAWGLGRNLLTPADGGYRLAVSISTAGIDRLRPTRAIRRMKIGPFSKPIYAPLVHQFESAGWVEGDLRQPAPGQNFFFFAYDWRRDNSRSAAELAAQLGRLAALRGDRLPVALICQSNGSYICRYLLKFGAVSLADAERGLRRPPKDVAIEQLILVGTANGGSLRILHQLNETRRYVPTFGRSFHPEVSFTFESLYQDLPSYREDLFVDPEGHDLAVDLWDAESWQRYGWSVFAPKVAARVRSRPDLFADAAARRDFLERALDRARRFQSLLRLDIDIGRTHYYMIENHGLPTPDRAVLRRHDSGWETLITGDRGLRQLGIVDAVTSTGDGHATTRSQRWLTAGELAAFGASPLVTDGEHFEMIIRPTALSHLLDICRRPSDG